MTHPQLRFKIIDHTDPDFGQLTALREDILRKPLGLAFSQAELDWDSQHLHVVAYVDAQICGAAMLVPKSQHVLRIQRVIVADTWQRRGIGKQLMQYCETFAKAHGYARIYIHARLTALAFYQQLGYVEEGEVFEETTIPHMVMQKVLA